MATGDITVTTAANFIPEIWSKDARIATEANLVMAKRVNRQFEAELQVGDTLHIPDISDMSVGNKSANTDVTFETITEGKVDVTIAYHKYVAFEIEDIVKLQANQDLQGRYTSRMGYLLGKAVDASLGGLYSDLSQSVNSQGTTVTDSAEFLTAVQYLDEADAPAGDRTWVINPALEVEVLAIDDFIRYDAVGLAAAANPAISGVLYGGEANPASVKGYLGQMFGVAVYISTNVQSSGTSPLTYHNLFFHRDAFILIMQQDIRIQTQYALESLADKVVGDCVYGVAEFRDAFAVDFLR